MYFYYKKYVLNIPHVFQATGTLIGENYRICERKYMSILFSYKKPLTYTIFSYCDL
jgi:hypothetical protein